MVSIRRPNPRGSGGAGSSKAAGGLSSLLTFRNLVIAVIIYQSFNLAYKSGQRLMGGKPLLSQPSQQKTLDDVYKDRLRKAKQKPAAVVKPPIIKSIKEPEAPHKDHDLTDTDDHIEKPPPPPPQDEKKDEPAVVEEKKENPPPKTQDTPEKVEVPEEKKEEPGVVVDEKKKDGPANIEPPPPAVKGNEPVENAAAGGTAVEIDSKMAELLKKHGTGPTQLGYLVDLVHERLHPPFRHQPMALTVDNEGEETTKKVGNMVAEKSVKSCERVEGGKLKILETCRDADTRLIAYNSADFPRTLCGHIVQPGQAVKLDDNENGDRCDEPAHVFPQDSVPLSGAGMPPIVVQQTKPGTEGPVDPDKREKIENCDVPCEYEKGIVKKNGNEYDHDTKMEHYVANTKWSILRLGANPYTNGNAKMERTAFRKDKYYSTMYMHSSIPLSHYCFDKYNLRDRPPISWDDAASKATYLLDDQCQMGGGIRRHKWYDAVKASGLETASYGKCDHNTDLADGETLDTMEGRIALAKKNKLHLAYEAGNEKDYVSPIVWESLLSGAVPAILGARNAEVLLPPHSAIFTSGYNDWDKFAADLKVLVEDKSKWESYHAWRTDDSALAAFEKRYNFTRTNPECRTCRWAYAKMYGLGWDHEQQVVRDPVIKGKLCLDDAKLVTEPFREIWVYGSSKKEAAVPSSSSSCTTSKAVTTVELDACKVDRVVIPHDGVVDMTIRNIESGDSDDLVLRLKFKVKNTEGAYFPHTHTLVPTIRGPLVSSASIQDEKAKVTVLANWDTTIRSREEGAIEIVVHRKSTGESKVGADETRRVRVITEDFNPVHDKLTEFFPSSYGKLMTKDFVDPLELFYADS